MNRLMRMLMVQNGYMDEAGEDGAAGGGGGESKTYTHEEMQALIEEQTGGLKKKVDELLGEKKSASQKARDAEESSRLAEEARQKEKGEFKALYEQSQASLDEERNSNKTWKEQIQLRDVKEKAGRIGNDLAKTDTKRAEVLSDYAAKFAKHDGEQVTYEIGGIEVSADKLKEHLTKEYPFLVDGNGSSGGGATGARGGAASDKTAKRSQFDSMGQVERSKFIKGGGKVVAD
jgi:DNA repair exonuclease SbcCD ATPase subunit